jgi:hypothetical protein
MVGNVLQTSHVYCWILLGIVGSYWVLLDLFEFCWILLSIVGSYWVLLVLIGNCLILLGIV